MDRVVVNRELRERLKGLNRPLELIDEDGRIVAQVTPVGGTAEWASGEPEISAEELARIEAEEDFSIGEVLDHLKKLEGA